MVGTAFQQYADPPESGRAAKPPDPVRVLFGVVPALRIWVLTPTRLVALAPTHDPELVGVTVQNIDADGVLIPGETVTKANAFEFKRPDLTGDNPLQNVARTLIQLLKREVMENVVLTTHTDYDGSPQDLCNITELAALPAVVLVGPRLEENRLYSLNPRKQVRMPDGSWRTLRTCLTTDLEFDIVALSNATVELLALVKECSQCIFRQVDLRVLRDKDDAAQGDVGYRIDFVREFAVSSVENESNVRQAVATFRVYGVDLDDADGLPGAAGESAGAEPTWELEDVVLPGSVQEPDGVTLGTGAVSVQEPDGVTLGTGAVSGQPGDGPYQYRSEDYWND